ncbi:hypothetical protein [Kangiella sp. TOML190]|uniref:hypothetical protein n=1 Tax=Kangiella sp. TOML190 TaxID=2931351 RepID=UPI002040D58A|nr:hypothetical protein [Kangiella sp. TOML190]
MLEQLLQYHQKLIPDAFVQALMARVEKRLQRRIWILGGFACLGAMAAVYAVGSASRFDWYQALLGAFSSSGMMLFSALAAMMLLSLLVIWLFIDDIEIY